MNGREFLDSARRLVVSTQAADTRSAVSRAYYAAFRAVRDLFHGFGIHFTDDSPEAHTKMTHILGNTNVPQAIALGGILRSLRLDRNNADYSMTDQTLESAVNANLRIKIAESILASVDSMLIDPDQSNLRRLLRPKARSMGVNVVGSD